MNMAEVYPCLQHLNSIGLVTERVFS